MEKGLKVIENMLHLFLPRLWQTPALVHHYVVKWMECSESGKIHLSLT